MKVLLVDDNEDITGLLSRYLDAKGFENEVINDPSEAVERIKEQHYDAVLLDISMPEVSGIDIIDALEKEKELEDQKIIILSALSFATNQINDLLQKKGIHNCLKKPLQLQEILTAIST